MDKTDTNKDTRGKAKEGLVWKNDGTINQITSG